MFKFLFGAALNCAFSFIRLFETRWQIVKTYDGSVVCTFLKTWEDDNWSVLWHHIFISFCYIACFPILSFVWVSLVWKKIAMCFWIYRKVVGYCPYILLLWIGILKLYLHINFSLVSLYCINNPRCSK